jgi:Tfp pilus assembly ATPase PilU
MNELLNLVCNERAEVLRLRVGEPPVIVLQGVSREVGPWSITAEDAEQFLLCIADTRHRREIWENGSAVFLYAAGGSERFLVAARLDGDFVELEIR